MAGVGARAGGPQAQGTPRRTPQVSRGTPAQKPSLVRGAITHLLHHPALALDLQPPYRFAALRQPGIELLSELVLLVRERPEISTGALLEHFEGREEAAALQKLAMLELPGEAADLRDEFLDAITQLDIQVLQQRVEELQHRQRNGELDDAEKQEMRELMPLVFGKLRKP